VHIYWCHRRFALECLTQHHWAGETGGRGDPFDTQHRTGAILGVAKFGAFKFGEAPSYSLVAGGQVVNVLDLGRQLLQKWEKFLADNSL
jgi:hypothetical protein